MPLLYIPEKMLALYPNLTKKELRTVIKTILNSKTSKLKSSHIVNFTIPHLGKFRTHGNKKVKRRRKELVADRKKKRIKYYKQQTTKERLLW